MTNGEVPPIEIGTHVPPIAGDPPSEAQIFFTERKLIIPD
jgi:hypothetical protein